MKKLVSVFMALSLCFAISAPVLAVNLKPTTQMESSEISPQVEETQWRYRVYNGERQKRLWSITNEVWLTDWMPY